jgi:hypothetical protein
MPRLPQPELPVAHHADLDSMLSRKFGKEVANYFSGILTAAFYDQKPDLILPRLAIEPRLFSPYRPCLSYGSP